MKRALTLAGLLLLTGCGSRHLYQPEEYSYTSPSTEELFEMAKPSQFPDWPVPLPDWSTYEPQRVIRNGWATITLPPCFPSVVNPSCDDD
jgi:hypothetical protein